MLSIEPHLASSSALILPLRLYCITLSPTKTALRSHRLTHLIIEICNSGQSLMAAEIASIFMDIDGGSTARFGGSIGLHTEPVNSTGDAYAL